MNDLQKHFDSLLHDIEFISYENDKDRLERIHYLIPSLSVSESEELLGRFNEKYEDHLGSRKGSRKGAESFATSGFNRAVNGITGTLKSKPVMNTLKRTTGTKDQRNQVVLENHAKEESKIDRQNKVNELRKGSGPLCDMGNISGKGSRPDNLRQISSSVVSGRKRSIHLEGEYTEESREGSRKGSRKGYTTVDGKSPMEYLGMLYDLQGFPSQKDVILQGSEDDAEEYLRNNASFYGIQYEEYLRTIFEEYEG